MEIVARVNNRILVGQQLCETPVQFAQMAETNVQSGRNKEFLDICMNVTKDVGKRAFMVGCLPSALRPSVVLIL